MRRPLALREQGTVYGGAGMDRTLARASIASAILFLVIVVALLFLAPEVDPLQYGISFYALTDFPVLIGVAIVLISLSAICLGIGLWPNLTPGSGRVGAGLLIGWGILSIPAGVFPLDPPDTVPTLSGTIHNIAGLSFLLAIPAVLLVEFITGFPNRSTGTRKATYWLASLVPLSAILLFAF